jgi:wyosine [tRNA(Phe)-imidazoG37] synthetase (radical SAM superfamily)
MHQEGVIPKINDVFLRQGFDIGKIHHHAVDGGARPLNDLPGQSDFEGVAVAVQVPAGASVVGNAMPSIEFQAAGDTHGDNQGGQVSQLPAARIVSLAPMTYSQSTRAFDLAQLKICDHSRESAGLTYVYPVVSRRAGGLSIGVNLNPNNACNWRCVYCQVPNLQRGKAPAVDVALLAHELRTFLAGLRRSDPAADAHMEGPNRVMDIAISGNGEPTSAPQFPKVVESIVQVMNEFGLAPATIARLITNGSLMQREHVRQGVRALGMAGGEVWFKVDAGTPEGFLRVNAVGRTPAQVLRDLTCCAELCPTWIQTCLFALDGEPPAESELEAYLDLIREIGPERLRGVLLYGIARHSCQPEAARLGRLSGEALEAVAERIRRLGLTVRVSP